MYKTALMSKLQKGTKADKVFTNKCQSAKHKKTQKETQIHEHKKTFSSDIIFGHR